MDKKVSQRKLKRACIDCHFLIKQEFYEVPDNHNAIPPQLNCYGTNHYELDSYYRVQFRHKDFSQFKKVGSLGCYLECWIERTKTSKQKWNKIIVETDRNDCCLFFQYKPTMSFKTAEKIRDRRVSLDVTKQQQDIKSLETTLSYYKTTGKFRFGDDESLPISPTSRHKVREMAEKLMQSWMKGKPCPQSEIVRDPARKLPRSVYDNTTTIRNSLKSHLKVNMPQCANDEYPLPIEPKYFKIVS
ncbi:MAG: hypothetical protein K8F52_04295 [Candidatus Scalindua rubra]|uniref:Uncharacterized protein n=1 Tax=Candidatus Scalindua brodae TaxID=237368 RepID=A0A0B0EKN1_9BACT|nr:MAG: hypothetical protein SCABRO_00662 [Candidatus Scalindua brodae]MBZ0107865.1 hypothetical protein [Candidatus Scalindua rubra]TWU29171.1 hypothetical protein S225a_25450 [Candidatus Brocadiaceae bacterium S225]